MTYDLVIQDGILVTSTGLNRTDIGIDGEKIAKIGPGLQGKKQISATGKWVLPGAVDPHVHLEMPTGVTVTSDTWKTGTKAAAFGGTTTVIDFVEPAYPGQPLMEAYRERLRQAQGQSAVDFNFHMTLCAADEETLSQVAGVVAAGMPTFKMYTTYPGFHLKDEELLAAFAAVAGAHGMAVVHSESDAIVQHAVRQLQGLGRLTVADFPSSRPAVAEQEAVERVLSLASYSGVPIYIVHVSTQAGAAAIERARQAGQLAWGETCPQYLLLDESRLITQDFSGAKFVCCPPLRIPLDQQALWAALATGGLQTVGTDHCAFNYAGQKDLGKDSFLEIPSGLPGIELRLALLYTYGVRTGKISPSQWVDLCCTTPARLFGLYPHKGDLIAGADADIVLFDPEYTGCVTQSRLHEHVDYTPYEGMSLSGQVSMTLLRGKVLVQDEEWVGSSNGGAFVPGKFIDAKR